MLRQSTRKKKEPKTFEKAFDRLYETNKKKGKSPLKEVKPINTKAEPEKDKEEKAEEKKDEPEKPTTSVEPEKEKEEKAEKKKEKKEKKEKKNKAPKGEKEKKEKKERRKEKKGQGEEKKEAEIQNQVQVSEIPQVNVESSTTTSTSTTQPTPITSEVVNAVVFEPNKTTGSSKKEKKTSKKKEKVSPNKSETTPNKRPRTTHKNENTSLPSFLSNRIAPPSSIASLLNGENSMSQLSNNIMFSLDSFPLLPVFGVEGTNTNGNNNNTAQNMSMDSIANMPLITTYNGLLPENLKSLGPNVKLACSNVSTRFARIKPTDALKHPPIAITSSSPSTNTTALLTTSPTPTTSTTTTPNQTSLLNNNTTHNNNNNTTTTTTVTTMVTMPSSKKSRKTPVAESSSSPEFAFPFAPASNVMSGYVPEMLTFALGTLDVEFLWDPERAGNRVQIVNNGLTVSFDPFSPSPAYATVVGTHGFSSGIKYWEISVDGLDMFAERSIKKPYFNLSDDPRWGWFLAVGVVPSYWTPEGEKPPQSKTNANITTNVDPIENQTTTHSTTQTTTTTTTTTAITTDANQSNASVSNETVPMETPTAAQIYEAHANENEPTPLIESQPTHTTTGTSENGHENEAQITTQINEMETQTTTHTQASDSTTDHVEKITYFSQNYLNQNLGIGKSWAFLCDGGTVFDSSSQIKYGSPFLTGDRVGVLLNFDDGTISFYVNGVLQGVAFNNLSGEVYPAVCLLRGTDTQITLAKGMKSPPVQNSS